MRLLDISEQIALLIDNSAYMLASMLEVVRRASDKRLAVFQFLHGGLVPMLFTHHGERDQAQVFRNTMRHFIGMPQDHRLQIYDDLISHYTGKIAEGTDMSADFDAEFHKTYPLQV